MSLPRRTPRRALACAALAAAALVACGGADGPTAAPTERPAAAPAESLPASLRTLRVPANLQAPAVLPARMRLQQNTVDVWVSLSDAPLAVRKNTLRPVAQGESFRATNEEVKRQLRAHKQYLQGRQANAMSSLAGLGAVELGRVLVSHNAVAVRVPAARVADIAALPGVTAVRPVRHYEMVLAETVPYVGAATAQAAGKDGTGVRVAVLDSGIDYTHRNLDGTGTTAAYAAAWGTAIPDVKQTSRDGLFPTAKVVDGFDFVGESWPDGDRTEDDDPIDHGGHGTHVADIIAGVGPNKGVAPGAKLVAVKVCSAVSSSCNGVALIKGMDFALDPDGDGDVSDAVDVINLSLGSPYGQAEDDMSFATANAVALGVSVVASAGNSADRPYIVGSPSSAAGVLSVAQTHVPSANAIALVINSPAAIAGAYSNTATLEWAPIQGGFSGTVKTAQQAGGANNLACAPLPAGSLGGFVALVDRGTCNISTKVRNASDAGASGVLVSLVAPGDAVSFSNGGDCAGDCRPSLVITQAVGNAIKANIAAPVTVSVSPAVNTPLAGSMVSTSSRGPAFGDTMLKPEIGAPGGSLSAEVGTGSGETPFSGTSGAAPMVAGAAAILRGAYPDRSPAQIKAQLMNAAHTAVYTNPATAPGVLAPVSRIGAGELRVDRALQLTTLVHNPKALSASLPFGFAEVDGTANLTSPLVIENHGATTRTYRVQHAYRYADDAASGATRLEHPATVTVPAGGIAKLDVRMKVDGRKLPAWGFASAGPNGGNGALLQGNEVDGYVTVSDDTDTVSVPFHALLRRSSSVSAAEKIAAGAPLDITNKSSHAGMFNVFAHVGSSVRYPSNVLPGAGDNFAVADMRAIGVRAVGSVLQFAVNRWDRRAHPAYPAEVDIYIDSNNDGTDDYVVYNVELTGFGATGQTVVNVANLANNTVAAYFYLDADLQSGTGIFTVPLAAVGLTPSSRFTFAAYAFDNYFTGTLTDQIGPMTHSLATPRHAVAGNAVDQPIGAKSTVQLATSSPAGGADASPSQTGFLVLYRQNKAQEVGVVAVGP